jgi:hypothetical protein
VSKNPDIMLNGSGSSDGENDEELDTSPDSSAPGSDSVSLLSLIHISFCDFYITVLSLS